ncbi:MAG: chain length determinant protein EpsF [Aquabacterium sp.]|uniref:chain length determinant protein EpsF n=1 Tax=Aquabacterium sp. TaxID=1872578 RepID=UPI001D3B5A95|nr:chain length determinant protein EpsF [Aquabacterium sp.]MBT9608963.1 chain length determinant protein EpsF [Aquabacterium sp.]
MTLDQFFRIVRARWMLFASVLVALVTLVVGVSVMLPKKYTSTATVMADTRPDPVSSMAAAGAYGGGNFLTTQIDIIKTPRVSTNVVTRLGIDKLPDMREKWQQATKGRGNYLAWLAEFVGRGLDVKPSRESNVIEISYEGIDPQFAATMANAFARAYIDATVSMRVDPARQYAEFFEERAKLARQKFEVAQEKLATAKREKGIVVTDERIDYENARLNEIASQITVIRAARTDTSSRNREVRTNPEHVADVLNNAVIASLKADVATLEAKVRELSETYGSAHPVLQQTEANLDSKRRKLRDEIAKVSASLKVNDDINGSRESQLAAAFETQRKRVLELAQQRNELQVLEREVEMAQRTYELVQARATQSSLEGNSSQSTVYLLSEATESDHHSSPRVTLNAIIATGLGILLGLIAVMLVELFDRRVRGPFDLIQITDMPVLGVLPNSEKPRGLKALLQRRMPEHISPVLGASGRNADSSITAS